MYTENRCQKKKKQIESGVGPMNKQTWRWTHVLTDAPIRLIGPRVQSWWLLKSSALNAKQSGMWKWRKRVYLVGVISISICTYHILDAEAEAEAEAPVATPRHSGFHIPAMQHSWFPPRFYVPTELRILSSIHKNRAPTKTRIAELTDGLLDGRAFF